MVVPRSKDEGASGKPLPEPIYKPKLNLPVVQTINQIKQECLPVADERCVHSRELFLATIPPQEVCDSFEKLLDPQGLIRSADLKKRSKERVIGNLKTDSL